MILANTGMIPVSVRVLQKGRSNYIHVYIPIFLYLSGRALDTEREWATICSLFPKWSRQSIPDQAEFRSQELPAGLTQLAGTQTLELLSAAFPHALAEMDQKPSSQYFNQHLEMGC